MKRICTQDLEKLLDFDEAEMPTGVKAALMVLDCLSEDSFF